MAENSNNNNNNPTEAVVTVTVADEKKNDSVSEEKKNDSMAEEDPIKRVKKMPLRSLKATQIALLLALLTFLLSLPLLFEAIWLLYIQKFDCEGLLKSLGMLQIGIAVGLVLLFFLSNGVVHLRMKFPAPALIVVMLPLAVMFIMGLSLEGKFETETKRFPASPRWLKMKVHRNNNWNNVKSCLYGTMTCKDLISRSYDLKAYDFTSTKLSPIEAGCCTPPSVCGMQYVNATYWRKSNTIMDVDVPYDKDCDTWQNDETMLCYDCHSCKEGFVKTLESKWLKLGNFMVVMSVLLTISHLFLFVATMLHQHGG